MISKEERKWRNNNHNNQGEQIYVAINTMVYTG